VSDQIFHGKNGNAPKNVEMGMGLLGCSFGGLKRENLVRFIGQILKGPMPKSKGCPTIQMPSHFIHSLLHCGVMGLIKNINYGVMGP